jgi:hypothetical protein
MQKNVVIGVHCEDSFPGELQSAAFGWRHIVFDFWQ